MKKTIFILALFGLVSLSSCSSSYDDKEASELVEKCEKKEATKSDVEKLLSQYEACIKEFISYNNAAKENPEDEEIKDTHYQLMMDLNKIEFALRGRNSYAKEVYPTVEEEVHAIWKKHKTEYEASCKD